MSYQEYLEEQKLKENEEMNDHYPSSTYVSAPLSVSAPSSTSTSTSAPVSVSAPASASAPTIEYTVLGKGGFGMVIKPALPNVKNGVSVEYPDNVTKIFLEENGYRKILKHPKEKLNEYMGPNNDHRINTYTKEYHGRNISRNLRDRLEITNSTRVWPVRIPDLGVDFTKIKNIYKELQKVPIVYIIQQFVKLMTQVNTLWTHKMIHGDIRPPNIMIHPTNGHMALIDFDWLLPAREFAVEYKPNLGFYNNPPEFLLIRLLDLKKDLSPTRYREEGQEIINSYLNIQYKHFEGLRMKYPDNTLNLLRIAINKSIEANNEYLFENPTYLEVDTLFKTFDSYGLANTLLVLINYLFPSLIAPTQVDREVFHENLSGLFSGYTPAHLRASVDAIYNITYDVLYPMSDLLIKNRMAVDKGLDKTKVILATLEAALTASPSSGGRRTQKRNYKLRKSKKAKQIRRK